jgi:hypothetical protein
MKLTVFYFIKNDFIYVVFYEIVKIKNIIKKIVNYINCFQIIYSIFTN